MARHWHLTGDPFDTKDFGNRIETRKRAEQLARVYRPQARRLAGRPIYVVDCARECIDRNVPGRRLG